MKSFFSRKSNINSTTSASSSGEFLPPEELLLRCAARRPVGLSPKNDEELLLHQKEAHKIYKNMVATLQREEQERKAKAEERREKTRLWLNEIVPNFTNYTVPEPRRQLIGLYRSGIPSNVRDKVWARALGNNLRITNQLVEMLREKTISNTDIEKDIARTLSNQFSDLFSQQSPYSSALREVLSLWAAYRPDIGYVQGMNSVAAVLLLNFDISDTGSIFIAFANLVSDPLILALFQMQMDIIEPYRNVLQTQIELYCPNLVEFFNTNRITPSISYLCLNWFVSLFTSPFPLEVGCRLFDRLVFEGAGETLIYACVAILKLMESKLMVDSDQCMTLLARPCSMKGPWLDEEIIALEMDKCMKILNRKELMRALASCGQWR